MSAGTRRRRSLQAIGLLILALLLCEGGLRLLGFGRPLLYRASDAGYELAPDQSVTRLGKRSTTNSLGARGPNVSTRPQQGVYRILSLGDSVANGGAAVNDAETYPSLLAARLNSGGHPVEVINASAGGWAVGNEAAWLKEHGTLSADLILLEVNDRDLDQAFVTSQLLDSNPLFPSKQPATAIGEVWFRYLKPRLGLSAQAADPGSKGGKLVTANVQGARDAVFAIANRANRDGASLVILYWDARYPMSPDRAAVRDNLLDAVAKRNIRVFRPNFAKLPDAASYFRDSIHLNEAGNARLAAQAATFLLEHGPFRKSPLPVPDPRP